uniref:RNA polymerase sigma factor sigD, chloroplastic n=1 Tax=Noccaea caerulescens TaxID=107243 RepID=A0A1J3I5T4_NOCCA
MATIPTTATATMCPSPPVPTISPLLRTTHQCQPSPSSSSSFSIKLSTGLVFGETTVDRATESSVMIKPDKWGLQLEKRRKRRRRRRLGFERLEPEEDENAGAEAEAETETEAIIALVGSTRSGFLSRSEEVQLCLYLKEGAKLENLGTSVEENEMESALLSTGKGKKKRSATEILCRRREAREKITRCYRRLVVSIATGYQGKGLNLQDLIQEGSIGLLRGAERFDPERGYKLSTYVYWWIKQAILRAIAHKSRLVKLPGSMWELTAKVAEASNVLTRKLKRIPICEEIAEHLNIHVSAVRLAMDRSRSPVSLDRVASHNGRMTLQEIVSGPDETRPEEMVKREHMKHEIEQLLGTLTARESRVLGLYFGLNGETPMSFEEIGKSLKLSRERVRQINGIALTKLRNVHYVNDLQIYYSSSSE